jgi:hypothetical protein
MAEGAPHTPAKPISTPAMKLVTPAQPRLSTLQAHSATAGVMSPVSQNGCFEFDRIIKAGSVLKRTRKTKVRTLQPKLTILY